jgi:FKBP-type peptidyl-prolyl cis-trans isomerase
MRKIAIVKYYAADIADRYGDSYSTEIIHQHITEFTEVTDEEFEQLQLGLLHKYGQNRYMILEKIEDQSGFIKKTVKEYQKLLAAQQAQRDREAAEYQAKKDAAAAKKRAKQEVNKAKRLKELATELGVEIVGDV